jgi:hypothetical protein
LADKRSDLSPAEQRALDFLTEAGIDPEGLTAEGEVLARERGWDLSDPETTKLVAAAVMALASRQEAPRS